MHEMSLAEGVVQIIEDTAARERFARVKKVRLEIGELSGVEVEAMRFCFDAVTRGGVAAGSELEIVAVPGEGWCMPCGGRVPLHQLYDACPKCGSFQVQAVGGTQMRIRDLLVD